MTERIKSLLERTFNKEQKKFRRDVDWKPLLERFVADGTSDMARARIGLEEMLKAEEPAFMEGERKQIPDLHTEAEMAARRAAGTAFGEKGVIFNLTADFAPTIRDGLAARLGEMEERLAKCRGECDAEGVEFLESAMLSVKAVLDLAERYDAAGAARQSYHAVAPALRNGVRTLHEALQTLRILHYAMWCEGEYHCGLGRIDQYLFPYYDADIKAGRLTEQSVMLGGVTRDGKPAFNDLSRLCMKACGELKLVDPKINLRVDKSTPTEIYELGTELTKEGLGFPQYANDDVVIPALQRWRNGHQQHRRG